MHSILNKYKRVWKLTHKPSRHDIIRVSKVTGLGLLLIGLLGFIFFIVMNWVW